MNFGVWWDSDLLRELLDGTVVSKWNGVNGSTSNLLSAVGCSSNSGTKATRGVECRYFRRLARRDHLADFG